MSALQTAKKFVAGCDERISDLFFCLHLSAFLEAGRQKNF